MLESIFWNREERRLRAAVRICLYVLLWRAATLLLDWLLIPPLAALYHRVAMPPAPWLERALHFVLYMVSVALVTWIAAHWPDRRTPHLWPADFGLAPSRRWWLDLLAGLLLGLLLMTLVFAMMWLAGWVTVAGYFSVHIPELPFALAMLGPLLAFTSIGICEEVIFRGYVQRNAAEGLRGIAGSSRRAVLMAWAVSSLLFGLFHVFNPNSSLISTINLMLAGVMFGLPVVLTGRLALAIGLHISWNFAQGTLFGFPVSGNEFGSVAMLVTRTSGPVLWTGGQFGPEAGLVGQLAILMGCLLILGWVRWTEGAVGIDASLAVYGRQAQT